MSHSFAPTKSVRCSKCRRKFQTEIWQVIDVTEHPDLFEKIMDRTIHKVACPHCGKLNRVKAPLLLYFPPSLPLVVAEMEQEFRMVFSPTGRTMPENANALRKELVEMLLERLDDDLLEDLEENGLILDVPRSMLPIILKDLEEALHQFRQQAEEKKGPGVPADLPEELAPLWEEMENLAPSQASRRIELLQQALSLVPQEKNPYWWGNIHMFLGVIYFDYMEGDRAENLEQAIFHFKQALKVFSREAHPEEWAATQKNLGNTYMRRIKGDRNENLEQARYYLRQSLEVYTREADPDTWARVQLNLGDTYLNYTKGDPGKNNQQAIHHYNQALEVYKRDTHPAVWGLVHQNLGVAYLFRLKGNMGKNIDRAIFHFEQALEGKTEAKLPPAELGMIQFNLALAWHHRIRGNKAANLVKAAHYYEQVLKNLPREEFPEKWLDVKRKLEEIRSS